MHHGYGGGHCLLGHMTHTLPLAQLRDKPVLVDAQQYNYEGQHETLREGELSQAEHEFHSHDLVRIKSAGRPSGGGHRSSGLSDIILTRRPSYQKDYPPPPDVLSASDSAFMPEGGREGRREGGREGGREENIFRRPESTEKLQQGGNHNILVQLLSVRQLRQSQVQGF